ncbi:unnamed protein product [Meloidogyne enterolobii]|uniref:Uncharacterized protein n=1 Tax=Meloidogyne enterolobii TaxID=390850 RepID=A0ACB0XR99_MELEN
MLNLFLFLFNIYFPSTNGANYFNIFYVVLYFYLINSVFVFHFLLLVFFCIS